MIRIHVRHEDLVRPDYQHVALRVARAAVADEECHVCDGHAVERGAVVVGIRRIGVLGIVLAVAIRIHFVGVGALGRLGAVAPPVAIAVRAGVVGDSGIEAVRVLPAIAHAVIVAVPVRGVRAQPRFTVVGEQIAVPVLPAAHGIGRDQVLVRVHKPIGIAVVSRHGGPPIDEMRLFPPVGQRVPVGIEKLIAPHVDGAHAGLLVDIVVRRPAEGPRADAGGAGAQMAAPAEQCIGGYAIRTVVNIVSSLSGRGVVAGVHHVAVAVVVGCADLALRGVVVAHDAVADLGVAGKRHGACIVVDGVDTGA